VEISSFVLGRQLLRVVCYRIYVVTKRDKIVSCCSFLSMFNDTHDFF
jgi:hypothetical protein